MARNRIDHITTSFDVLFEAFGEYGSGDPDKTMAQWDLNTPEGAVASRLGVPAGLGEC